MSESATPPSPCAIIRIDLPINGSICFLQEIRPFQPEERRSSAVVRLLNSHLGEPGSIFVEVAPGFLHVGIVPDDATCRRVFSGISRLQRPSPAEKYALHSCTQFNTNITHCNPILSSVGRILPEGGASIPPPRDGSTVSSQTALTRARATPALSFGSDYKWRLSSVTSRTPHRQHRTELPTKTTHFNLVFDGKKFVPFSKVKIPALLHARPSTHSSPLNTSTLRATQISSLTIRSRAKHFSGGGGGDLQVVSVQGREHDPRKHAGVVCLRAYEETEGGITEGGATGPAGTPRGNSVTGGELSTADVNTSPSLLYLLPSTAIPLVCVSPCGVRNPTLQPTASTTSYVLLSKRGRGDAVGRLLASYLGESPLVGEFFSGLSRFSRCSTFALDSTVVCTDMTMSTVDWLSAVTVEGDTLTTALQEVSNNYNIEVKHVYTEVDFAIGSPFIRHALDDSEPITDLQGNKSWGEAWITRAAERASFVMRAIRLGESDPPWLLQARKLARRDIRRPVHRFDPENAQQAVDRGFLWADARKKRRLKMNRYIREFRGFISRQRFERSAEPKIVTDVERRNERAGEMGDPRENPLTNGIVRHDSHLRKSGSDLAGEGESRSAKSQQTLRRAGPMPRECRGISSGMARETPGCLN
ncbi:hypothetical protein PR048_029648 [Dryococelus australis]|uniref:Uncharacterized protein n=1 Tax=Dryococelus australis TaxID=614101 RepID=A0ABQ9GDZ2_9NEOP|nr:hypothetical protein PR048_029648 [Dryococelus australis]